MPTDFIVVQFINNFAPVAALAIVGWTIVAFTRARRGKLIDKSESAPASLQPLEQRLDRLEQSNEAIALQVERIAEGQRFVTKLLSNADDQHGHLAIPNKKPD